MEGGDDDAGEYEELPMEDEEELPAGDEDLPEEEDERPREIAASSTAGDEEGDVEDAPPAGRGGPTVR